ncbi:CcdB protein [Salinihabitans flavidus]|uniref:Toxin CcdB n=1 Tax=Salinihabitans flavidus TaxID=569882 RepID=A0A1H8V090_9RHOB|nr:CcdB family protein [Salinihabitans flavidus]SEP08809.1 CcdB protein [Salinihabitans flavidus]
MAQFHVYRVAGDRLLLDLQTDLIDTGTRVVAPLLPRSTGPTPLGRLEPILKIGGVDHVLHTAELAAVPSDLLRGASIADLSAQDYEIKGALDMVFSGF